MTVEELIRALQHEDPKSVVAFAYSVGDYWQTTAVAKVTEVAETTVEIEDSGYGYNARLPREGHEYDHEDDEDEDETESWVVLSQ
jgi:hypothetical protein